nr:hypothetical protein [Tanacetum cinerariifolium]
LLYLSYTEWDKHEEKDEQATTVQIPVNATIEFVDDMNFDMDFGSEIPTDGPATVEMVNATKESFDEDDLAKFREQLLDAEKPLYKGCPEFTKLSTIVKLLNLMGKYGASDKFFPELLGLLKKMLHAGNEMVEKTYHAKKLMRMIGSGYKKIHVDNKKHKVYENIPAKAWRTIDEKFPKIAKDPRNLRLGISADGVDVNSGTRHHSLWLVLSVIYNLPPWVDTYDDSTKENFNLRAVMLWTINDYPALGGKIQKQKRKTTEEEGSSNQVNEAYWKKFNIWYRKLRYWRHNSVPHCIDFMHVEKNVCESLVKTLLYVPGKTKDGMNARLDMAELGIKPELFARKEINLQELDKLQLELVMTLCLLKKFFPLCMKVIKRHVQNKNRLKGCIAKETIVEETIVFFSEYHKTMKTIAISLDKHVTNENDDEKPLSAGKSSEVSEEVFQKAYLYVIQNTDEIVPYIERHRQVLKTKNLGKRIALLENEHSKSFARWLHEEVERELAISKDSVSKTVRWISYGPRATIVKYEAYNINVYTFCTKSNNGIVYQNSRTSNTLHNAIMEAGGKDRLPMLAPGVIPSTSVSRPQLKSNQMEDRVMLNNSQGKKQEVEDHRRNVKFSKNKTYVTACNDSLNAKTSNVRCRKCVLKEKHDMCVLHSLNGVNSRTKMPMVVPISTKEPKRIVKQSVAKPLRRTKHAINLELKLQQCQEKIKHDKSFKENQSKEFRKEREQYFEIQDLKAQLQDKGIAIRVIPSTSVSRPQLKSNQMEDRVMLNNSQGKKQEVEDHRRNVKFSKNKTYVTACNDSLNAKTSNVRCRKCVLKEKHDMCVLHSLNGVNSRT